MNPGFFSVSSIRIGALAVFAIGLSLILPGSPTFENLNSNMKSGQRKGQKKGQKIGMNRLKNEKSPYLQQHADNPVWWYPWGKEALDTAKAEGKPIFLSVGYSTCHWCHVMEHESFEDEGVAKLLNDSFIAIKVDREERPDVDAVYMDAIQKLTGHGGWPMSVWLTPEGKPFVGGTYYPKGQFIQYLTLIAEKWITERAEIEKSGERVFEAIQPEPGGRTGAMKELDHSIFDRYLAYHARQFDSENGGFGERPKFPQAMSLMALMRISLRVDHPSIKSEIDTWVTKTLDHMASGGMYDHLGGGFHRYSTDDHWLVPHFEKMLYDNALLALTYLEAFQLYKNEEYAEVVREILDYVLRDMTHAQGGFFSAEDADSAVSKDPGAHREEGFFYTFSFQELKTILSVSELKKVQQVYDVTKGGNFEHRNIFYLKPGSKRHLLKKDTVLQSARKKLFEYRNKNHVRPRRDDKVLAAWNGLMIAAMTRAGSVLDEKRYVKAAKKAAEFLLNHLYENGELYRRWVDGEGGGDTRINAYSTDYSALVFALIALYETDFDPNWITRAKELQKIQDDRFWDKKGGGYLRDDGRDKTLIVRLKPDYDGVRPTSNSLSALNLLKLRDLTLDRKYQERAIQIFEAFSERLVQAPIALSQMVSALDYWLDRSKEIAVVGPKEDPLTRNMLKFLRSGYFPNTVLAYGEKKSQVLPLLSNRGMIGGKTTAYVCEGSVCKFPTSDLSQLKKLVSDRELFKPAAMK